MPHHRIVLLSLTPNGRQTTRESLVNDNGERVPQQLEDRLLSSPTTTPKLDEISAQGDLQARFYDHYHKVAEEYDKEFLKKHDEDLNTTLIFVSPHEDLIDAL